MAAPGSIEHDQHTWVLRSQQVKVVVTNKHHLTEGQRGRAGGREQGAGSRGQGAGGREQGGEGQGVVMSCVTCHVVVWNIVCPNIHSFINVYLHTVFHSFHSFNARCENLPPTAACSRMPSPSVPNCPFHSPQDLPCAFRTINE